MKAQDLKNSILQLAIQGRLVEQRKEEGTAKELLEQIKAEKELLIKEKKIKKEKPLPEITEDEIPFEIPEYWEWVRFGELVNYKMGKTPQRSDDKYWRDDYYWVSIADMIPNSYIDGTKEKISTVALKEKFNGTLVPKGTLLMSFKLTVGRVSILNIDAVHNEAIISIYPYGDLDNIIRNFLFQILTLMSTYGDTKGAIKGKTLNSTSLSNLLIPIPPLEEQKRIVAKIEELMPYAEKYGEAHSKLEVFNKKFPEDMQKSILQYAIQGKLVEQRPEEGTAEELYPQIQEEKAKLIKEGKVKKEQPLTEITEDEIPFEIPESWKWVRLGEIVSIKGGKRLPAGKQLTQKKTDHIYIRVTDMKNQTIDDTDLHYVDDDIYEKIKNYIIEKSDIYVVIVGSTIGKVGLIPERFHGMNLTENAARLIPICMDKDYLMRYLSAAAAQKQFIDKTKQVGQPKLALIRLKNTLVPVPPLKEQKRIVVKIEELLPYCQQLVMQKD